MDSNCFYHILFYIIIILKGKWVVTFSLKEWKCFVRLVYRPEIIVDAFHSALSLLPFQNRWCMFLLLLFSSISSKWENTSNHIYTTSKVHSWKHCCIPFDLVFVINELSKHLKWQLWIQIVEMLIINRSTMRQYTRTHTHKHTPENCGAKQAKRNSIDKKARKHLIARSFVLHPLHDCRYHSKPLDHEIDVKIGLTISQ